MSKRMSPFDWIMGGLFTVLAGFAINYMTSGKYVQAAWFGFFAWTVFGIGALVFTLKYIQATPTRPDPLEVLRAQGDAQLRPYLGVSGVSATMEIGKPVSVVVKFTNNGETPAEDAELRGRLEKLPVGQPLDRRYDGPGFERVSRASVNRGNTIEAELVSRDEKTVQLLTLEDVMQLNTTRTHYLAAHGVVRYRSKHIPGGSDETPFCYEFEPVSSQWIACRVEANQKDKG